MGIEIRDSIHTDIANQFPAVYKDNSDFLVGFIEAYYQHLDSKFDRDLPKLRDVDSWAASLMQFLAFLDFWKMCQKDARGSISPLRVRMEGV